MKPVSRRTEILQGCVAIAKKESGRWQFTSHPSQIAAKDGAPALSLLVESMVWHPRFSSDIKKIQ
jgi:hypothetical protein